MGSHCHVHSLSPPPFSTTNYHVRSSNIHKHTSITVFLSSSISTIPTRRSCPQNHKTRRKFSMAYWNSTRCNMVLLLYTSFIEWSNARSLLWIFSIRDTSNFPSQITNPIGKVILGFNENNSLNLDLGEFFYYLLITNALAISTITCDMNHCILCCCSYCAQRVLLRRRAEIFSDHIAQKKTVSLIDFLLLFVR